MTWWAWVLVALTVWAVLSVACAFALGRVMSLGRDYPSPPSDPPARVPVFDPYRRSVDS